MESSSRIHLFEAGTLTIILLYWRSAEEIHSVEKSCPMENLQALETENRVTSFCNSLQ